MQGLGLRGEVMKSESTLHLMTRTTPTVLWNDSCSVEELGLSIEGSGTAGATCNPVIVHAVLKKEMHLWKDRFVELAREASGATEDQLAWRLAEEMSVKAAKLLEPFFRKEQGRNGRHSAIVEELSRRFPDFRRAHDENAMAPEEFDGFGATRRTLREFCSACSDVAALMRDFLIPDPDA
jgi:hypothetical protein